MASVGNVRIGSRNIDIRASTRQVEGQTVTGFWGVVRGMDSDWLALFNHDTGTWAWFRPARDKLAGVYVIPPFKQPEAALDLLG